MKQAEEKYKIREISYLFQTLEKEWERSGRTVTKRKLNQACMASMATVCLPTVLK